jgi:hypothetical protein
MIDKIINIGAIVVFVVFLLSMALRFGLFG